MTHTASFTVSFASLDAPALARQREPVTFGVPMPRGLFVRGASVLVDDAADAPTRLEFDVLNHWPDGSVRWLLVTTRVSTNGESPATSLLRVVPEREAPARELPLLSVEQADGGVSVDTGALHLELRPGDGWPVRSLGRDASARAIDAAVSGLFGTSGAAAPQSATTTRVWVERSNEARALVCARGHIALGGKTLELDWQFIVHAQSPVCEVAVTVRNPEPAMHPGGYWELGDPGSACFDALELRLALQPGGAERHAAVSAERGAPLGVVPSPFSLYQESSGGAAWQSSNHVNRHGVVPMTFNGYRRSDTPETEGTRATPILSVRDDASVCTIATRQFWENFPKALAFDGTTLGFALFPGRFPGGHELQGGEQKTHRFAVAVGDDGVTAMPLDWWRSPLVAVVDPRWVCESGAIPYLWPERDDPDPRYAALVRQAIEGSDTFNDKRERIDEYGWRHFGEIYGDHEAVFHDGPAPLVSHYNNQYDPVGGFAYQFLRSGDPRWWPHCEALASHVADIDIYHTDKDKSAYNHGLFWHTVHYVDAGKATHRTYPKAKGSPGGGPADEQNYATGLALHYFLTGDPNSRDAAVGLAQFVIDIDDGSKTVFRWLDGGFTGLASSSRSPDYHGPGRGSGNSLAALVDGFRLSGDRKYLAKAEQLMQRCVHPEQDIARLTLLDAENRWFYTMFLQALGRYLDLKVELGELDEHYAYGRETLLHFARWMAEHEYPFLEKPEILEYPTETWPAQDMRKSEIFKFAALHTAGDERARFEERADYFFDYCVRVLGDDPRRSLARPVVLLLPHGWMHGWFKAHRTAERPQPQIVPDGWPVHQAFVPQKARAMRRAKAIVAVGAIAALMLVSAALFALMS